MLTVLIYQKSSQSFIDRYRTLFEEYEESGQIAFCFWDEHGTDVQSALPELTSIVRGIRQWQAVVVMPHLEDFAEEQLLHKPENPFDYLCNSQKEPSVHESGIPLIRLAQMLGGIPLVNKHYDNTFITNEDHTSQMIVSRRESDKDLSHQQKIWNDLNDKYSFPSDRPQYVYLFKARMPQEIKLPVTRNDETRGHHESDSSLFWYRNRYPARARFLIQDCTKPGNAHYQEDLFRFWMTALTLSMNDFPSGTFEAYKVYQTISNISFEQVHDLFSRYYNRLSSIQFRANLQIGELQKRTQLVREQEELPLYQCEIPVYFELQQDEELAVSSKHIGFAGDCPTAEEPWWHLKVANSMNAVRKLYLSTKMVLDRASMQSRYASRMTEEEICELDEYQFEEMDQQLSDLEKRILTFNTYTALPMAKYYRDLGNAEKETADAMKKRMSRSVTIIACLLALVIYVIGFIPDFMYQMQQGDSFLEALGLAGFGCGVITLVSIVCLYIFRKTIQDEIGKYNEIIYEIINNFQHAGTAFSNYLSDCSSYMRGKFMLQALTKRTLISSEEIVQLGQHVEHLDSQMGIIANWLSDLDMKVSEDNENHNRDCFDFGIPPEKNRGYSIQIDSKDTYIEFTGGSECKAPYPFVVEFSVERESLFEEDT